MARENSAGARWRRSAAAVGFAVILVPVAVGVPRAVFAADSQPTIGQLVTAPTSADSGSAPGAPTDRRRKHPNRTKRQARHPIRPRQRTHPFRGVLALSAVGVPETSEDPIPHHHR